MPNIPYIKEILIGCIGLNVAFLFLGMAPDDYQLVTLAVLSGGSCILGVRLRNKMEQGEEP
jgi:hypothetical protein